MNIRTPRLLLRTPERADAARLSLLAGDYDVACMTGSIPHPIASNKPPNGSRACLQAEEGVVFAILRSGVVIGCTGYRAFGADHAELGYWIGKPYWGMGYGTEAVEALVAHAFGADGFDYLTASHFADNPASERVLKKPRLRRLGQRRARLRGAQRQNTMRDLPPRPRRGACRAPHSLVQR